MFGDTMSVSIKLGGFVKQSQLFFSLTLTNKKCSRDDVFRYVQYICSALENFSCKHIW